MSESITTYEDLIKAKQSLKLDVSLLEREIMNSKIVKVSNFVIDHDFHKKPNLENLNLGSFSWMLNSSVGKMATTFVLSNRKLRKYFVAFLLLKETVPIVRKLFRKI